MLNKCLLSGEKHPVSVATEGCLVLEKDAKVT